MFNFKYIKKYNSEKDKNHQTSTNIACIGIIHFANIEDESFCFNPGSYFEFYLKCLPKHDAMAELHDELPGVAIDQGSDLVLIKSVSINNTG